jgi:quinone-modifying oxidoreductase subunit QmoB
METKVGVYICKGCDIAESLDIDKLIEMATGECQVPVCKAHEIMCTGETVANIKLDVEKEELNRVVIAACSQRVFPNLFNFGDKILVDRTNLREQVAWSHAPNDDDTQMLAADYIRSGIAKARNSEPAEPHLEETSKDLMVVRRMGNQIP